MCRPARPAMAAVLWLAGASAGSVSGQEWQPPPIRMVPHVFTRVSILGVRPTGTTSLATARVEAAPGHPGRADFDLDFALPRGRRVSRLSLTVEGSAPVSEGAPYRLRLISIATLEIPGRGSTEVRRERSAEVSEGATFLQQAFESEGHDASLVLTLSPETRSVPEPLPSEAGPPVLFNVSVSRVVGSLKTHLEDDLLRTLEGSAVAYAFRLSLDRADIRGSSGAARTPATSPDPEPKAGSDPDRPQSAGGDGGEKRDNPTRLTQDVELTLLPRRSSAEIMIVEASLRSCASAAGAESAFSDRTLLLKRTQAVTRNGTFELTLEDSSAPEAVYNFEIRTRF